MKRDGTFESWRERNKKNYLSWWSRKRSKGKFHFIWTTTLWSALMLLIPVAVIGYFVDRDLQGWTFRIPFSLLGGLIISLVLWWSNEAKYKNASIDARIKLSEVILKTDRSRTKRDQDQWLSASCIVNISSKTLVANLWTEFTAFDRYAM